MSNPSVENTKHLRKLLSILSCLVSAAPWAQLNPCMKWQLEVVFHFYNSQAFLAVKYLVFCPCLFLHLLVLHSNPAFYKPRPDRAWEACSKWLTVPDSRYKKASFFPLSLFSFLATKRVISLQCDIWNHAWLLLKITKPPALEELVGHRIQQIEKCWETYSSHTSMFLMKTNHSQSLLLHFPSLWTFQWSRKKANVMVWLLNVVQRPMC